MNAIDKTISTDISLAHLLDVLAVAPDAPLVFNAANKLTLESPRGDESRLMDVALVEVAGVVLVLVYVLRHHNEVRAISLRRASKQERKLYASWQETH